MADSLPPPTGSYKSAPFKFRPNPALSQAAAKQGVAALDDATGKTLPTDVLGKIQGLVSKGGKKTRRSKKSRKTAKRKSRK